MYYYDVQQDQAERSLAGLHGDGDADGQIAGVDTAPFKSRCIPLGGVPRVDPRTGRKDSNVQGVIVCRNDKGEVYESVTFSDGVQILKLPRYGISAGVTLPLYDAGGDLWSSRNTASPGDQYWYKGDLRKTSFKQSSSSWMDAITSLFS